VKAESFEQRQAEREAGRREKQKRERANALPVGERRRHDEDVMAEDLEFEAGELTAES
jgi:hypothetical protein